MQTILIETGAQSPPGRPQAQPQFSADAAASVHGELSPLDSPASSALGSAHGRVQGAPWTRPRTSFSWRSSEERKSSRRAPQRRQMRLLRGASRADLGRRRCSTENDLTADFLLEGTQFVDIDAKKRAMNVFGIGSLRGVEAYRVWKRVFEALKDPSDGEVPITELRRALDMIGFQNADQEGIDAAKQRATQGSTWPMLNKAQFNEFLLHFGTECDKLAAKMFAAFDADGSGLIDRGELESVLENFGIVPMRHVLDDVMVEVDEDGSGDIDLDEFRKLLEILRLRSPCFSREEFQNLVDLFQRIDFNGSSKITKRELASLLEYLDYHVRADERDRILQEVDIRGSGELSEFGFIFFMRKCRHVEMMKLTDAFNSVDAEADGVIPFGRVLRAFTKMGYEPDPDATREAAKAVGISSTEASLDISDTWRVFTECRAREWFSSAELRQIDEAFEKVDETGSGEVGIAHLDKALLAMGLSLRTELLLFLVGKVDLDCSGLLSQVEFRKLVRAYQLGQAQLARATFQDSLDADDVPGLPRRVLSIFHAWEAFSSLGLVTQGNNEDAARVRAMGSLDLTAFLREAQNLEKEQQMFRQQNSGFSEQEVHDLLRRFEKFDEDRSGALQGRELAAMIDSLMPGVANEPENRPMLMKMLAEAQGRIISLPESDMLAKLAYRHMAHIELKFTQFLKLLSLVRVFKVDQHVQMDEQVIEECNLSIHEVQQFRELFLESVSVGQSMTMNDLWLLFEAICPLGDRNKAQLQWHIREVVGSTTTGCEVTITCAQLMTLVGRLRDANFGGIRDRFFS